MAITAGRKMASISFRTISQNLSTFSLLIRSNAHLACFPLSSLGMSLFERSTNGGATKISLIRKGRTMMMV